MHVEVDDASQPIEGSGFLAPVMIDDQCVGCGLCQTRCYSINVRERGVLTESAILVEAGDGKEDRIMTGSYLALRQQEKSDRDLEDKRQAAPAIPSHQGTSEIEADDDPFGLGQ